MTKKQNITTTTAGLIRELKKNNWIISAITALVISVVAAMLVFCYFSMFTSNFYPKNFKGQYMVGVTNTTNYYGINKGDLVLINGVNTSSGLAEGQRVFFSGGEVEGVGQIISINNQNSSAVVQLPDEQKTIQLNSIIGVVAATKAGSGYVLWFFTGYVGAICLNVLLILIATGHMIFAYNLETSKKGWQLKAALGRQRKERRRLNRVKKMYSSKARPGYLNLLLDGNFAGNKARLIGFAENKGNVSAAYKFTVKTFHQQFVVKEKLSTTDRRQISNCLELMGLIGEFDMDDEYMLADLILHAGVYQFDVANYANLCLEYLEGKHTLQDLMHFEYIFYLLIKQNPGIEGDWIRRVADRLEGKIAVLRPAEGSKDAQILSTCIKNLIKI